MHHVISTATMEALNVLDNMRHHITAKNSAFTEAEILQQIDSAENILKRLQAAKTANIEQLTKLTEQQ